MKKSVSLLLIALLSFITYISFQRENERATLPSENSFMNEVNIIHVRSNHVEWSAKIHKVVVDSENDTAKLFKINFMFPEQEVTTFSDVGTYDMRSDDLVLSENVKARQNDMDITTQSLVWNANERKIESDSRTLVTGKSFRISGNTLSIAEGGTVTIKNNVHALVFD